MSESTLRHTRQRVSTISQFADYDNPTCTRCHQPITKKYPHDLCIRCSNTVKDQVRSKRIDHEQRRQRLINHRRYRDLFLQAIEDGTLDQLCRIRRKVSGRLTHE